MSSAAPDAIAPNLLQRGRSVLDGLLARKNLVEAGLALIVRILSALVGYGVQIYLANTLALSEYGIYVTLWTWLIVANHVSVLGFSETAIRYIPRYASRNRIDWALGFLRTGFWMVTAGSIVCSAIVLSALSLLSGQMSTEWFLAIGVVAILLPATALELYMEGVSRAFGWYMLTIVPPYIIRPLTIAAGVAGFWYLGHEISAALVLGIAGVVTALTALGQALIIRARLKRRYGDIAASRPRPFWIWSSLPLAIVVASEEVFYWSDVLILGFLVPSPEVSVYFAALRSMALATFIQYAFYLVTARNFSIANADGDRAELQARITESTNWTFGLTIPAVLATLVIGYPLLHVFGPEFVRGYPIMFVLGFALILRSTIGQAIDLLVVLGYQRTNLATALGGLATNLLFSLILVPQLGVMGAAIGTAATYLLRAIFLTLIIWKYERLWMLPGGVPTARSGRVQKQTS